MRDSTTERAVRTIGCALALLAVGCGDGGKTSDTAREASAANAAAPAATPPAPGDTTCPMQGEWRVCSVKKRLEGAGLVPVMKGDTVRRAYLSVPGTTITLGPTADLVVFVYPSRAAREKESAALDSAAAAPKGASGDWKVPPVLMTTNNLLAILLAQNEQMIERVSLAVTAGLPAADPSTATRIGGVDVKAKQ
jgi:hypothetical protein